MLTFKLRHQSKFPLLVLINKKWEKTCWGVILNDLNHDFRGLYCKQKFDEPFLSPSIKVLLLCFQTFLFFLKISIEFNLSDHVLNSRDLNN